MEGKRGKSGARTGRTVRSHFAQTRGKRSEGLLMHSTLANSSGESNEDEGGLVIYSLGKQNRWLLPEVIKKSSVEFEGEVVLVERYASEGSKKHRRPGSLSVFNSKNNISANDSSKKPKRKCPKAKDLPRDGEEWENKTRYEVTYPHPAGSCSKSIKTPAAHLGKRKKNSSTSRMLQDDFDDLSGTEYPESEDEEGFYEQFDRTSSLGLDLGLFVSLSSQTSTVRNAVSEKSVQHKEHKSTLSDKCIYVDSDDEMHESHLEILAQISAGCSLLDAKKQDKYSEASKSEVQKNRRQRRKRNQNNRSPGGSVPPADTCTSSHPVETAQHPNIDEGVIISLRRQEVTPAALAQQWGTLYKEGASYPRTFLLNVAPLLSACSNKEVFTAFRVFDDRAGCESSDVKALVTLVICKDDDNSERIPRKFISEIQVKSAEQEILSLEDIANVAALCFHPEVASSTKDRVDYKEPRQPRLSLEVFSDLFGWKSKTFSSQGAQREIKETVTKANKVVATSSAALASGEQQFECEICFKEMQGKGEDD